MDGERDFDFICRWCGHELILQTESLSDPFSTPVETWWHLPEAGASYSKECHGTGDIARSAEPTRWTDDAAVVEEPVGDDRNGECRHCGAKIRRYDHLNGTHTWTHARGLMATCRGTDGRYLYPVRIAEPVVWTETL